MTIQEIQAVLQSAQPKPTKKPAAKPKPAATTPVRPADVTAQQFARRVRIISEDVLNRSGDHKMALQLIHRISSELDNGTPAVNYADDGLRHNAARIVRALELDLTPDTLVQIVENFEVAK